CPSAPPPRGAPHHYSDDNKQSEGLVLKPAAHAAPRHVSRKDQGKRLVHSVGLTVAVALSLSAALGIMRYTLKMPLMGGWLNMRWLTGLVGLVGIVGLMAYPVGRQICRGRGGPRPAWMARHSA